MTTKPPKLLLKEELDKLKKFGARWEWDEDPKLLGNGRFSTTCKFYQDKDRDPITGKMLHSRIFILLHIKSIVWLVVCHLATAEGQGIKGAEHEVAKLILAKMEKEKKNSPSSSKGEASPKKSHELASSLRLTTPTKVQVGEKQKCINESLIMVSTFGYL